MGGRFSRECSLDKSVLLHMYRYVHVLPPEYAYDLLGYGVQ